MVIMILLLLIGSESVETQLQQNELKSIIEIVEAENLQMLHWEITLKDEWKKQEVDSVINHFNDIISIEKQEDNTIYSFIEKNELYNINTEYKFIQPRKKHLKTKVIISIISEEKPINFSFAEKNILKSEIVQKMSNKVNKYTCVHAINDDIMKKINLLDNISRHFNLQYKQHFTDYLRTNVLVTEVYGYNNNWNEHIELSDRPINIQIVSLQSSSEKEEIIIGTPLLIHEY